jgi:hypothetical protein
MLFLVLPLNDLLTATTVCKKWYKIYSNFNSTIFNHLLNRDFDLTLLSEPGVTLQQAYKTQLNITNQRYIFTSTDDKFAYKASEQNTVTGRIILAKLDTTPTFVWPCAAIYAYIVVFDGNIVCWLDVNVLNQIYIGTLVKGKEQVSQEYILKGHDYPIGLLLSNGKGNYSS